MELEFYGAAAHGLQLLSIAPSRPPAVSNSRAILVSRTAAPRSGTARFWNCLSILIASFPSAAQISKILYEFTLLVGRQMVSGKGDAAVMRLRGACA